MSLPKTYWDDLLEEAKERFAHFYVSCIASEGHRSICAHCPADGIATCSTECGPFCVTLFKHSHRPVYGGFYCPCKVYGKAEAAEVLRLCLVKDGWIED